jgi:hypothetical protein
MLNKDEEYGHKKMLCEELLYQLKEAKVIYFFSINFLRKEFLIFAYVFQMLLDLMILVIVIGYITDGYAK